MYDSYLHSHFALNVGISALLCLTFCNPMDCSPPGSSVHGILQARILEWVAISFSRDLSKPGINNKKRRKEVCATLKSVFVIVLVVKSVSLVAQLVKEPTCQCRRHKRCGFDPWFGKIPWGRHGSPLQYSCLKNPMDRGAWQAAVHRTAKSRTQLKQLGTMYYVALTFSLQILTFKELQDIKHCSILNV